MYQQTQPYTPPNSAPPATTYTYDALGRTVSVLLPDGASQTTYAYQGNFTTVTDPAGNWKQYATDALGNLVMVLEPDPTHSPVVGPPTPSTYPVTSAPTGTLLTTYTYDQFNHLTQVSMPRTTGYGLVTQTRTFAYASTAYASLTLPAVWLTSATNPESGTTSYTYNADGTLASKKDANGNTETYTYDAYQRLTGIPDRNQYFTYDTCPSGVTICANAPGQLMEAIFASGVGTNELSFTYGYAYTPAGKVASKSLLVQSANHLGGSVQASGTLTASYGYDGQGALVSQQYPISQTWASGTSNTFTYTLDALERPTQMTDSTQKTWASAATYNAANQPLYDGTATRTYNNLLQMTSIVASGLNMTYNYSATKNDGQIASSVDGISGETVTYNYDALKRLSGAGNNTWSAGYIYDGYGNLFQISGIGPPSVNLTVQVDGNNVPTNRIVATGVTYDNNGNQTAGFGGLTFSYDRANRMVGVGGSASEAYWYDSSNLRVYSRNASGAETICFYGVDGKKLATYTYSIITYGGGPEIQLTQQSANVYFLGKLISEEGNAVQVDRLGSVRSGGPGGLGHHAQYPYGVEYSATANDREKYATYTRDSVTGLDYAMNRYYTSQWGRFLSPDPYGGSARLHNPQSWNRYAYVSGDPINGNDPFGLDGGPVGICGAASFYGVMLTGPSAACNSIAVTATSAGLDTWSTVSSGLSQGTTITQVDIGAVDELVYAQLVNGSFWASVLGLPVGADPATFDWTQSATGICLGYSGTLLAQCQQNVFALSGTIGCSGLPDQPCQYGQITLNPPGVLQPPPPVVFGPLGPTFAPNPTQPTCQKGFHPAPMGGGIFFDCEPNPSPPVTAPPPAHTPILPPEEGGIPREGTGPGE